MPNETSLESLEAKLMTVLDRLTFFPDEEFLENFPFGQQLVEKAKEFGGIETVMDGLSRDTYFESTTVPIPSPEQMLTAAEIVQAGEDGRKRFEFSEPGTRKTLGVLSAIPLINEGYMPMKGRDKIKTLGCCPTYIIPTWIRDAERLLRDPNIVVVTRTNRTYAVKRAAEPDVDIVLLGYELSYRKSGIDLNDPDVKKEINELRMDLLSSVFTVEDGYKILEKIMKPEQFEKYKRRKRSVDKVIDRIILEKKNAEVANIATALKHGAFNSGRPYFAVYDEIHNIIDPNSATGSALSDVFLSSDWGALVTGTGIRNKLSNLAYIAYLDGRIEDPKDFALIFRNNPKIIRCLLDLDANPVRTLEDVDPEVKEPLFNPIAYERTREEIEIDLIISNSDIFEGKDQYLLLNYLYTNPKKLHPDNFRDTDSPHSLRKKVEEFFDDNPEFLDWIESMEPSKLKITKELVEKAKNAGRKTVIACEFSSNLTDFLENEMEDYGVVKIDQSVSAQMGEKALTGDEINALKKEGFYDPKQKFRSHLSSKARKALGIEHYQIFDPSPRQLALLEFQTNPEKTVLVATYGSRLQCTSLLQ